MPKLHNNLDTESIIKQAGAYQPRTREMVDWSQDGNTFPQMQRPFFFWNNVNRILHNLQNNGRSCLHDADEQEQNTEAKLPNRLLSFFSSFFYCVRMALSSRIIILSSYILYKFCRDWNTPKPLLKPVFLLCHFLLWFASPLESIKRHFHQFHEYAFRPPYFKSIPMNFEYKNNYLRSLNSRRKK